MDTKALLDELAICVEKGKANRDSTFPPDMVGRDGAAELTEQLLAAGIGPGEILKGALMVGMSRIGEEYSAGRAFIPQLLIAARAMNASMDKLKPLFEKGDANYKGHFIIGTVEGDLHDIGKNIIRMVLEGDGWQVLDLGTDVKSDRFIEALRQNPGSMVGMSALLTTTMVNMEKAVRAIKQEQPGTRVFVGGAPLSDEFSAKIGADGYFPDPHGFVRHLATLTAPC